MESDEKARVAERVRKWGEEGLQERTRVLKEACQQNEVGVAIGVVSLCRGTCRGTFI